MTYDLSALHRSNGISRHVWIGERSAAGGDWIATVRFASGMKPHDQVVEHLSRTLGSARVSELKIAVGEDNMWRNYECYSRPPRTLSGSPHE